MTGFMQKVKWSSLLLAALASFTFLLNGCGQAGESSIAEVSQSVSSERSSEISVSSSESISSSISVPSSESSSAPPSESQGSSSSPASYMTFEQEITPNLHGLTKERCQQYFSDAVFVGDSIMMGFGMFVRDARKTEPEFFTGLQFHVGGSYGTGNALWDVSENSVHPMLRGKQTKVEDALPIMGAKKAVLLFGLNDIGVYGVDGSVENYGTLCDRILEKSPDLSIIILSATPILDGAEKKVLNNKKLQEYNQALKEFCTQRGFDFLDIASSLALPDGSLRPEFCSDAFVHETYDAYKVWTKLLLEYAAEKLDESEKAP